MAARDTQVRRRMHDKFYVRLLELFRLQSGSGYARKARDTTGDLRAQLATLYPRDSLRQQVNDVAWCLERHIWCVTR